MPEPPAPAEQKQSEERDAPAASAPPRAVIHVVDDDPAICLLFERALSGLGYRVRAVGSGFDLEHLLESERPDVILLDIMLPWVAGPDVLQRLVALGRVGKTRVILMSALSRDRADIPRRLRGLPFLHKPFRMGELAALVERELSLRGKPSLPLPSPEGGEPP